MRRHVRPASVSFAELDGFVLVLMRVWLWSEQGGGSCCRRRVLYGKLVKMEDESEGKTSQSLRGRGGTISEDDNLRSQLPGL